MRYNRLGNTGLFVSELCFGTMTFGAKGRFAAVGGVEQEGANQLIARSLEAGINFIDTADVYSEGLSEEMTGRALKELKVRREEVLIATKVFGQTGPGPNDRGSSRAHILDGVKASLKRLQLDHIDLYQLHGFDPATPIEESIRALDWLVQQGYVRYIGVSNWAAWQIMDALGTAERLGLTKFVSNQAYYSLAGRDLERELVPMMTAKNVGLMVWSPLAGGLLGGKYGRDREPEEGSRRIKFDFPPVEAEQAYDVIDVMRSVASAKGCTVAQVALAWLLHQQVVSTVIIGAKRLEQLNDNLGATDVKLTADELAQLDGASKLANEYPGWMLRFQGGSRQEQLAR
jgi:aryl-alcohol dehydrogenase-like predicted oxidoreductase